MLRPYFLPQTLIRAVSLISYQWDCSVSSGGMAIAIDRHSYLGFAE
ncbi:hypothetical protein [Microcystis viridis]|nr:hypothetical protein [Microcystis viridis]